MMWKQVVILAKDDAGGYIGKMREGVCYNLSFPLARSLPRHVTILNDHSDDDDDDNNEDGRDDRSIGRLLLHSIYSLHNPQFVQPSIPASSASPIWFKERSHKFQSFMLMSTTGQCPAPFAFAALTVEVLKYSHSERTIVPLFHLTHIGYFLKVELDLTHNSPQKYYCNISVIFL